MIAKRHRDNTDYRHNLETVTFSHLSKVSRFVQIPHASGNQGMFPDSGEHPLFTSNLVAFDCSATVVPM